MKCVLVANFRSRNELLLAAYYEYAACPTRCPLCNLLSYINRVSDGNLTFILVLQRYFPKALQRCICATTLFLGTAFFAICVDDCSTVISCPSRTSKICAAQGREMKNQIRFHYVMDILTGRMRGRTISHRFEDVLHALVNYVSLLCGGSAGTGTTYFQTSYLCRSSLLQRK